jgi:hypothetical protein
VLLCQFFVLVGNRFWFYILLIYLEYHTVVVTCYFFWFWQEIVFGLTYVLSVQYSCAVVSVFCCGRKANLVRIFLLNPNFLLVHRNKLSVTVYLFLALYGSCCMLPSYVPYKGTYVPYDGTFGAPDQGQTLDV